MPEKTPFKPVIGRYMDALSDGGFKYLFGSEPHKELLIAFLNELLKGRKQIIDLVYNKNELNGPQPDFRKSIYDLTCTGQDGTQFLIEIQRIKQEFFRDRAIYYTSSLIHDQGPKGRKDWNYELKEIYLIGLMDFAFDDALPGKYLHRVRLSYVATGKVFYPKLEYIFIEIPKFTKTSESLKSGIDRWLFVLKNLHRLQKIPLILNKRVFAKLFQIAEIAHLPKNEYMLYEKNLMAQWDDYAIRQTIEKESRETVKADIVRNLITKLALADEQIAELAEVSISFVKKIRLELKKQK